MAEDSKAIEEKVGSPHPDRLSDPQSQLEDSNVVPSASIPNGGLGAWLTVLAGFCVFVNSWCAYNQRDTLRLR